jgi:amidophosphoribosyltransferase
MKTMRELLPVKLRGDHMEEECGIIGIYDRAAGPVGDMLYYGLYALQHRGQESAGIAISTDGEIRYHKGQGLVTECFEDENVAEELGNGSIGIGHVRYSTSGDKNVRNAQPLVVKSRIGELALAHNGNLVNAGCIREKMEQDGVIHQTDVDTEVIANLIARQSKGGIVEALQYVNRAIRGSYALVMMTPDSLIAMRDPMGIRPLALGRMDDAYIIASESCAFDTIGGELVRDIRPGEILIIDKEGMHSMQTPTPLHSDLCVFEFVYFARSDSVIDGISVYEARHEAGRQLARQYPVEADLVIGVPDSALAAAMGYAAESKIPYGDGLAKNRYVGRTFIQPWQSQREQSVKIKLNALKKNVQGKRIIMVDDSIVRGTTSKKIVEMLRAAGAVEVHMRISSPPVTHPCHFGIDTAEASQLISASYDNESVRQIIGADSLEYLSLPDLLRTVETASCGFCKGCFDGAYPIDVEKEKDYNPFEGGA